MINRTTGLFRAAIAYVVKAGNIAVVCKELGRALLLQSIGLLSHLYQWPTLLQHRAVSIIRLLASLVQIRLLGRPPAEAALYGERYYESYLARF